MKFYVTFGQDHPLRDGWIEVRASSYVLARLRIFEVLGTKWASMYYLVEFDPECFPAGKFGNTLI